MVANNSHFAEYIVEAILNEKSYDYGAGEEEAGRFGGFSFTRDPNWSAYWVSPNGTITKVPHHESWARTVVLKGTEYEDPKKTGVYAEMRRRGWVRLTVTPGDSKAFVNPQYCGRNQLDKIISFCMENDYNLYDETARTDTMIFNAKTGSTSDPDVISTYS